MVLMNMRNKNKIYIK